MYYVDMDGVMADFVTGFENRFGDTLENLTRDENEFFARKVEISHDDFFLNLPPMDGVLLIKYFIDNNIDFTILTSVGVSNPEFVAGMKRQWLINHFGYLPNFEYTTSSSDKAVFARECVTLIDDREKSLIPFKNAGGNVIKYTNFVDCLQQL